MPSGAERRFGEFTLLLKLGWGGMADVFLAKASGSANGEFVVIKRLKADLAFDPDHCTMFEAEAKLALRFDHPNVVKALGHGEIDGQPYLVLEYLEGQTLDRVIAEAEGASGEHRGLARGEAIEITRGLLRGLDYAHELCDERGQRLEIVHRDVSPHNVFVTTDGQVKLVDFGIAKSRLGEQHTVTGVVKGKLAYMAPEQALANTLDRRADLFAAGVVLWELAAGARFWGSFSDVQILKAMTFGDLPKAPPGLDHELARVLARALTATPDVRYSTATMFLDALASLGEAPIASAALGLAVQRAARSDPESVRHLIRAQLAEVPPVGPAPSDPSTTSLVETSDGQALPPASIRSGGGRLRNRLPWLATAAVVLGASALVIGRVASPATPSTPTEEGRTASSAVAPLPSLASSAPVRPPEDPRDQVTFRVIASPTNARIQLDGVDVATNPFVAKFRRDGAAHKLVVSAVGYAESAELVVFDKDVALERKLVALRPGAPLPSARPTSSSAATSGPFVDKKDPWAPRPH